MLCRAHRTFVTALSLLLIGGVTSSAAAAQERPVEEPIRLRTGALELQVGGRVQTLFSTTSVDSARLARWEMRRARIELDARLHPRVSGRVQGEFRTTGAVMRDAYVVLHLAPGAELLAGNAYRPFGLLSQTSSRVMLPVERGASIRGLQAQPLDHHNLLESLGYVDRDVGLQLRGALSQTRGISYALGLTNGPLDGAAGGRSPFQASARVRARVVEDVHVAAGWSRRDFAGVASPDDPAPRLRTGNAFEIDVELGGFRAGPHLMAEVAIGDLDPFQDARFTAAQAIAAYRTASLGRDGLQLEPLLRVSHGSPGPVALRTRGGTLLTPGLNLYFNPLNRVMLDLDLWRPLEGASAESSIKLMFQMAF